MTLADLVDFQIDMINRKKVADLYSLIGYGCIESIQKVHYSPESVL